MNKTQLAEAVADRTGHPIKVATAAVNAMLDEIMTQLARNNKVALMGFGTFEPVERPARTMRNPATGGSVEVPASMRPKFKAGATFINAIN